MPSQAAINPGMREEVIGMQGPELYNFIIIGAGQGGPKIAKALAAAGKRVAIIERKHLGGSCINYGCTPTKAAISSSRVAQQIRRAGEYGVDVPSFKIDFAAVLDRANSIATRFREGMEKEFLTGGNPRLIYGVAQISGRDRRAFMVRVNEETLSGEQIIIDTGARSKVPAIDGLDTVPFIQAENWLNYKQLPEHIVFIGGGFIAIEMAQFYRRMGSQVTIVERTGHILKDEDLDVSDAIHEVLVSEGVEIKLNAMTPKVERKGDGVVVHLLVNGKPEQIAASHIFVSAGRKPNIHGLGLETVGVESYEAIFVDNRLSTNVKGIWAIGDTRGGPMFTHTSWDDFRILRSQLLEDGSLTVDRIVPYAIFCDPELGRVGLTEKQAKLAGFETRVNKFAMANDSRSIEMGETKGFIKVIVDANTDLIVGAAVLAANGAELVHTYVDLMNAAAPFTVIRDAIHIHPTQSESLQTVLADIDAAPWDESLRRAA
jgi:pyruvate/2-oxoglutarate dehydrogenase complex dihydrolipoamide dehydrogenase (E3) component